MPLRTGEAEVKPAVRQRKTHVKSRSGCVSCKLRSVKCDEIKPSCKRCISSGFRCTWTKSAPALELVHPGALKWELNFALPVPNPCIRLPLSSGPKGWTYYELRSEDFTALERFRSRTVKTMTNKRTRFFFGDGMLDLARQHPFLYHVFLAIVHMHDRYLSPSSQTASQRSSLAFHWYHGASFFNKMLSRPRDSFSSTELDCVWVAGAMLSASGFANIDTYDPCEAWPLKEPDLMDLSWLKMSVGKNAIGEIAQKSNCDSIFHRLLRDQRDHPVPSPQDPIVPGALPRAFGTIFGLDEDSPYYGQLSVLSRLLPLTIEEDNVSSFIVFAMQMNTSFKSLLEGKDPRALLLLAWWYAKVVDYPSWYLRRRSMVEGMAICIYLERQCAHEMDELLEFPKAVFEATSMGSSGGMDSSRVCDDLSASSLRPPGR